MGCFVAVALVLLMDASGSIRDRDWETQLAGHAAALRSPEVAQVVAREGGIAVTAYAFSDESLRMIPWRVARNAEELGGIAEELGRAERGWAGGTNMGGALQAGLRAHEGHDCEADQRVIDLVTDGEAAVEGVWRARDIANDREVRINAMAVGPPSAEEWLRQNAITRGGFALRAETWDQFAAAIRRKITLELAAR